MRFFAFLLLFLGGCGDPVERHIAALVEGGDEAEVTRMEPNLAGRHRAADPGPGKPRTSPTR
jgi:hypothetical protein